jgi:hypothetical protein
MLRRYLCIIILIIISIQSYSQTEYRKHISYLKKKSQLDSTYRFTSIKHHRDTIISEITYFGKTKSDLKIFYIQESYIASLVHHGFMMLYLIDSTGKKYFYHDINKPDKLENGILSFKHLDNLDNLYYYKADLNKKIPLFICQDKDDCYSYVIK